MRLYYSVRLKQTGDASYYIGLVGLYAAIENCIGILCTCMPVFPRFFKVVGPKFVSLYKNSAVIASQLKTSTATKPTRNLNVVPVKSNSTWNTSSSPQSQIQGTYSSLDDSHELIPVETKEAGVENVSRHGLAGSNGIQVTRMVELGSSPALPEDMDLEGQKRIRKMGWWMQFVGSMQTCKL